MSSEYPRRQAALGGIPFKHLILGALILQNVALVFLIRYSRTMPLVNGDRYYASTAVFLAEVVKFAFFLSMALYEIATSPQTPETSTVGELSRSLSRAMFTGDSWKLALPAMLFVLQNTLQYVAAGNMDATTFSITYQLKAASTAVAGFLLLGKAFSSRKWLSLGLMAIGVAMVQISHVSTEGRILSMKDLKTGVSLHRRSIFGDMAADGSAAVGELHKRSATYEGIIEDVAAANPRMNATIGVAAVVCACIVSGFACTFFERILKTKGEMRVSIWTRNVQLSFYSAWPALFLGVLFVDGEHVAKTGFFTGYNWVVWCLIVLQAVGGILTALAISHTDSMTKSLTTSVSSAIIFLASLLVLELHITTLYMIGFVATVAAAFIFSSTGDETRPRPPPISVTQYHEKDESGYFDLEAVATAGKSALRDPTREALSTSRPGTPVNERRPLKKKSAELRFSKRDQ